MSDKQEAFVTGIAAEFPGVPHAYCQNHFLRDLAKPVLEQDSHAKVRMRSKVRGLRAIEREVIPAQSAIGNASGNATPVCSEPSSSAQVVLEYCAAVRGILNDDQGGPLHPPGLRMAEALTEVRDSLQRIVGAKKGACRAPVNAFGWLHPTRLGRSPNDAEGSAQVRRRGPGRRTNPCP